MSAVVEAIEGIVDFAGDVVESVLDDPLTAIATAAAFSMGIPFLGLQSGALAAGVANTAAGLVQGEDFDEALKGGVMAGSRCSWCSLLLRFWRLAWRCFRWFCDVGTRFLMDRG